MKKLTDISHPSRLRVKGADTDSITGCRVESGETGVQVSDGSSLGEPTVQRKTSERVDDSRARRMKVWIVTGHFSHDSGYFDSVWSSEEKAKARAAEIEKIPPQVDWTEINEAEVDQDRRGASPEVRG